MKCRAVIFLIIYLGLRYLPETWWRGISVYYSYVFELFFVLLVARFFRSKNGFRLSVLKIELPVFLVSLLSGFLVNRLAGYSGIVIPFDLKSSGLLVMLLLIAPVLEELIFRYALWRLLDVINNNRIFLVLSTTFLFSLGHLISLFYVPEEFKVFVVYQFLYVILLGLFCGWRRQVSGTVVTAIFIHFFFNLGFYLGRA
jgi:membrane protease YdiL (CAAX protease family)